MNVLLKELCKYDGACPTCPTNVSVGELLKILVPLFGHSNLKVRMISHAFLAYLPSFPALSSKIKYNQARIYRLFLIYQTITSSLCDPACEIRRICVKALYLFMITFPNDVILKNLNSNTIYNNTNTKNKYSTTNTSNNNNNNNKDNNDNMNDINDDRFCKLKNIAMLVLSTIGISDQNTQNRVLVLNLLSKYCDTIIKGKNSIQTKSNTPTTTSSNGINSKNDNGEINLFKQAIIDDLMSDKSGINTNINIGDSRNMKDDGIDVDRESKNVCLFDESEWLQLFYKKSLSLLDVVSINDIIPNYKQSRLRGGRCVFLHTNMFVDNMKSKLAKFRNIFDQKKNDNSKVLFNNDGSVHIEQYMMFVHLNAMKRNACGLFSHILDDEMEECRLAGLDCMANIIQFHLKILDIIVESGYLNEYNKDNTIIQANVTAVEEDIDELREMQEKKEKEDFIVKIASQKLPQQQQQQQQQPQQQHSENDDDNDNQILPEKLQVQMQENESQMMADTDVDILTSGLKEDSIEKKDNSNADHSGFNVVKVNSTLYGKNYSVDLVDIGLFNDKFESKFEMIKRVVSRAISLIADELNDESLQVRTKALTIFKNLLTIGKKYLQIGDDFLPMILIMTGDYQQQTRLAAYSVLEYMHLNSPESLLSCFHQLFSTLARYTGDSTTLFHTLAIISHCHTRLIEASLDKVLKTVIGLRSYLNVNVNGNSENDIDECSSLNVENLTHFGLGIILYYASLNNKHFKDKIAVYLWHFIQECQIYKAYFFDFKIEDLASVEKEAAEECQVISDDMHDESKDDGEIHIVPKWFKLREKSNFGASLHCLIVNSGSSLKDTREYHQFMEKFSTHWNDFMLCTQNQVKLNGNNHIYLARLNAVLCDCVKMNKYLKIKTELSTKNPKSDKQESKQRSGSHIATGRKKKPFPLVTHTYTSIDSIANLYFILQNILEIFEICCMKMTQQRKNSKNIKNANNNNAKSRMEKSMLYRISKLSYYCVLLCNIADEMDLGYLMRFAVFLASLGFVLNQTINHSQNLINTKNHKQETDDRILNFLQHTKKHNINNNMQQNKNKQLNQHENVNNPRIEALIQLLQQNKNIINGNDTPIDFASVVFDLWNLLFTKNSSKNMNMNDNCNIKNIKPGMIFKHICNQYEYFLYGITHNKQFIANKGHNKQNSSFSLTAVSHETRIRTMQHLNHSAIIRNLRKMIQFDENIAKQFLHPMVPITLAISGKIATIYAKCLNPIWRVTIYDETTRKEQYCHDVRNNTCLSKYGYKGTGNPSNAQIVDKKWRLTHDKFVTIYGLKANNNGIILKDLIDEKNIDIVSNSTGFSRFSHKLLVPRPPIISDHFKAVVELFANVDENVSLNHVDQEIEQVGVRVGDKCVIFFSNTYAK